MASAPLTAALISINAPLNSTSPPPPSTSDTSSSPTPTPTPSSTPPASTTTPAPPDAPDAQPPQSPPPVPPQSPPPSPLLPPNSSPPPQSPSPPPPAPPTENPPVQPSPALPNPSPVPTPSTPSLPPPLPLNPPADSSGEFTPPPSRSGSGSGKLTPPGGKHGSKSPPPPSSSSSSSSSSSDDGNSGNSGDSGGQSPPKADDLGSNQALFTGIGLGIGLFIIVMLISALIYVIKKKRKPQYYPDAKRAKATSPRWQGKGMDHNIKIPPPPSLGGGRWQQHSPSPLSGDNSGAYSGGPGSSLPPPSPNYALGFNKCTFSYEELAAATGGFSPSNMIGQGGFGYVYKGVLPTGKDVAVKQLKSGSGQGEREFQAEVEIISRVHHRHLVSLVGYCISGAQRMLIYEFVPNNTLEYHLHGKGLPTMDWPTRLKIAIGSAKGLAYLHEDCHPRIIHRDIKASNILIDYKFEAMVADFGLAKLNSDTNTHVSTRVMGTFGYLAPEYASSGKLSEKSDVFSFGVMLLELISGRKPVDHTNMMEDSLVDWARPMLGQVLAEEKYEQVVDPKLEGNYSPPEMARMIACAAASVRHSARRRPKMSQIVRALEGDIVSFDDLNDGVKPGQSSQFGGTSSTDFESGTYSSKMRQFRRIALEETNEYNTEGDYSGMTSEYGLNPSDSSAGSSGEMRFADKKSSAHV